MNPRIQLKTTILPFLIAFVLACFGLSPTARAVVPAPDGGYPNGNTAEGNFALQFLTTGTFNTALGIGALFSNTAGLQNTATGAGALFKNTADNNTATGAGALQNNTTGNQNTANGTGALFSNTTIGVNSGHDNTASGFAALLSNTTGRFNTAGGSQALGSNTTGKSNSANGYQALFHNTLGDSNTANGDGALFSNTDGHDNTAVGYQALLSNSTGDGNTAVGFQALLSNSTGDNNTAIGINALINSHGSNNIALGRNAGAFHIDTGSGNIDIGSPGFPGESDTINIGNSQTRTFIHGISNVDEGGVIKAVYINSGSQLGTQPPASSRRFKKEIKPMDQTSEAILGLKPVTFHYKSDAQDTPQFGLIAEEVAKVNPDLIVRDKNGEVYSVRYDAVNAMLLNEFLKEHRKVEQQEATIAKQQKQIDALTTGLQKVSDQLELNKPAPQTVANNQ